MLFIRRPGRRVLCVAIDERRCLDIASTALESLGDLTGRIDLLVHDRDVARVTVCDDPMKYFDTVHIVWSTALPIGAR